MFSEAVPRTFSGLTDSPGKRSATGEDGGPSDRKHKKQRPGLPAEPFVYVAITAAFPEAVLRTFFRATGSLSPGKRSATGEMAARLAKTQKQKAQSSD